MKLMSASYNELTDPFNLFDSVSYISTVEDLKEGHCLILWGGEDIGTRLYGQKPNKYTYQENASQRDKHETALVSRAVALNIPIIGVCRGAQLLCALTGGALAQHVEGHGRSHAVCLHDEGDVWITCNSSHHQMMLPPDSAKVLATSHEVIGIGENNQATRHDRGIEVVYFPTLNALGIQPHPEWSSCPVEFIDYCKRKIKEYLL